MFRTFIALVIAIHPYRHPVRYALRRAGLERFPN